MGASIQIKCPHEACEYQSVLRFDPGPDDNYPGLATAELKEEHPAHNISTRWRFVKE